MGILKSCEEEDINTIHNISPFELIDSTVKPKVVEKELYCIPICNASTGKIEINTHLKKDQSNYIT